MRWLLFAMLVFGIGVGACASTPGAIAATHPSWRWYKSPVTQCVVSHEGGWTSVNPAGYYGRFQMDRSFMRETAYGRRAYARWGLAHRWPPRVQVFHAWTIWRYAGWSRWPTYARYCR